jgi:hypothetical protein
MRLSTGGLAALLLCAGCSRGARDVELPPVGATAHQALEVTPRNSRRLSARQLNLALEAATAERWLGPARVADPNSYTGFTDAPAADLLALYAPSLGTPDYNYTVRESGEATVTFSKYAEDAARAVCAKAASKAPSVLEAEPTLDEPAARRNVAALLLRFWGAQALPADERVTELLGVERTGGWSSVCVALATHPNFLTY